MGNDQWSENYAGTIDEVKVYSRALSAAEVAADAQFFTDTTPPSTPTNLAATVISASQINLSWTASTDTGSGVADYRVERCSGSSTCTNFAEIAAVTTPATSYSDTGLTASTIYRYRIRARDAANNYSAYSSIVTATTQAVAASGLLAWYRMEETGTITSIADSSGSGRTATNHGAVSAAGRIGNGFAFDGTSAYISFPSIALTNTFTVALWLYTTGSDTYANLFSQDGNIGLQYKGDVNKLTFWFNTTDHASNTVISRNQWHHVALVNNAGSVTFYLDGVADGTATGAPGFTATVMGNDQWSENYAGTIDEVKVYSRALSQAEVQASMTGSP
jgi:chitodextrinase